MIQSSVTAVGNPYAVAHLGAALNTATKLNLPSQVVNEILSAHQELTSPLPLVADLGTSQKFSVSSADFSSALSGAPTTPVAQNTGRSGGYTRT